MRNGMTWNGVKPILHALQVHSPPSLLSPHSPLQECFPGNVHKALIIKSDRFWEKQKASIASSKFKFEVRPLPLKHPRNLSSRSPSSPSKPSPNSSTRTSSPPNSTARSPTTTKNGSVFARSPTLLSPSLSSHRCFSEARRPHPSRARRFMRVRLDSHRARIARPAHGRQTL